MQNTIEHVDAFLKKYGMNPERIDIDICSRAFQKDMERGLKGEKDAWMMMLPTYLSLDEGIPEDDSAIVIDAGGTNFRIALVTFASGEIQIEDLKSFPMPGSLEPVSWKSFVEWVADTILPYTSRSRRVGLCFSYAAEILPNRDGRVLKISKQVQITGSEGKELGRDISAALARKGAPSVEFVVLNDTVAALLGGVAGLKSERFDGYVGLIYGTGVNTCYVERSDRLGKLETAWGRDTILINMESARFDGACQGAFDRMLDEASVDTGRCHYEKMVSGRYQGEIIFYALRQGAQDGLFSPVFADKFLKLDRLTMVQADEFCSRPYGQGLLAAVCQTEEDRETVYRIIDQVVERSARLICANLSGILLQTGAGRHIHRPACIVAEGSSFYKGKLFRGKLERLCAQYTTGTLGRYYAFRQVKDANLIGTAAAALLG